VTGVSPTKFACVEGLNVRHSGWTTVGLHTHIHSDQAPGLGGLHYRVFMVAHGDSCNLRFGHWVGPHLAKHVQRAFKLPATVENGASDRTVGPMHKHCFHSDCAVQHSRYVVLGGQLGSCAAQITLQARADEHPLP
jgi:hypothetical protein